MANEHSYIRLVHKYLDSSIYKWKICDEFQGGVPDCFYEGEFQDLWVEYKYIKPIPKRPSTLIDLTNPDRYLSKLQQHWLTRRYQKRKDSAVIAGSTKGGVLFLDKEWELPISTEEYLSRCIPAKQIARNIFDIVNSYR